MSSAVVSRNQIQTSDSEGPAAAPQAQIWQLRPRTVAGARLVALAEEMVPRLAQRAAEHDRDGTYPFEAIDALKASGYFLAPIPAELGGLGVSSVRDMAVAASRLAAGDPSVAIGINMHFAVVANLARRWRLAVAGGNQKRMAHSAAALEEIVAGGIIVASAGSEANQDLTRPATVAVPSGEGWLINGHKIFATMSPVADLFFVTVSLQDESGRDLYGYARVPRNASGLTINDDWDALGMRASGSGSVTLKDVYVPRSALPGGFLAGKVTAPYLEANLNAGLFHAAASLGIAEAAHLQAASMLARKLSKGYEPGTADLSLAAQNAVSLVAMQGVFERAGNAIDDYYAERPAQDGSLEEVTAVFTQVQAAKTFINEAAVAAVDRAIALAGGAGYMSKHPLSRAYRDVRAGAFMHPLGANRAGDFIAQVSLGLVPDLS